MDLTESQFEFLTSNRTAAMITAPPDGPAKAVRVGIAMVNGHLWSSGTEDRVRTERLRREPACTLFVFEDGPRYLSLETTVTILDGPDVPERSVELFRVMQDRPTGPLLWHGSELDLDTFREQMVTERRLIYQFDIDHAYGMV